MPVKREIIYPFFLECCQFADDVFWQDVFEDLAYGKAPYGTFISKDFLCCGYKNKEFSYKIERGDPKIIYSDLYVLLNEKAGILSQKEKQQKKILFVELEKNIKKSREDWSAIRKKNIRNILYGKYVIDMKNKFNLNFKQAKELLAVILISITFKTIIPKDIKYEDGKIVDIQGIDFEEGRVIYKRKICGSGTVLSRKKVEKKENKGKSLVEDWEKYVDTLKKFRQELHDDKVLII